MRKSALEIETWRETIERDCGLCIECGRAGADVHEIVPRSALPGKKNREKLFALKNRAVLCLVCHQMAASVGKRRLHLQILHRRHGYDYSRGPWRQYWEVE